MKPLSPGDPQEIGSYRVVGRLGAGGMGVVYAAVDATGRRVAVKLVHEALSVDLEFRRRFSREVRVLGEVEGACLARVLDSDTGAERPWLATEFIPGPTLEQHVLQHGPLTGDALYGLAAGLAEALVAMHAAGVVHRDLKPSNVILSPQGPRVIDFGIAKAVDSTSVTHTGTLIGSPGWISPEEYGDGPVGTPADVHGWALLVLYAAGGAPPYGTGRPEVLAFRVLQELPDVEPVPEDLRDLVRRALAKDPAKRPLAAELLADVVGAWRGARAEAQDGAGDVGSAEAVPGEDETDVAVTSVLLQRTWVLPPQETPDWPDPADAAAHEIAHPTRVDGTDGAPCEAATEDAAKETGAGDTGGADAPTGDAGTRLPAESGGSPGAPPAEPPASAVPATVPVGTVPASARPRSSWLAAYTVTIAAVTAIAITAIIVAGTAERSTSVAGSAAAEPAASARSAASATSVPDATPVAAAPDASVPAVPSPSPKPKKRKKPRRERVSFRGIKLTIPKSWRMVRVSTDRVCIESPGARYSDPVFEGDCRASAMAVVTGSGEHMWPGNVIDDKQWGWWYLGNAEIPCLRAGRVWWTGRTGYVTAYDATLVEFSLRRMADGRRAAYREWSVSCSDFGSYTMKIWHLPQSKVSLIVMSALDEDIRELDRIAASANLLGYRHAAPV